MVHGLGVLWTPSVVLDHGDGWHLNLRHSQPLLSPLVLSRGTAAQPNL